MIRVRIVAAVALLLAPVPAFAAPWHCMVERPFKGGYFTAVVLGEDAKATAVHGEVDLNTHGLKFPYGLRDGTYKWVVNQQKSLNDAIMAIAFAMTLPAATTPAWGTTEGTLVPQKLGFLMPLLRDTNAEPLKFRGLSVFSDGAMFQSKYDWHLGHNTKAMVASNAPDKPTLAYSREVLQLAETNPAEPIVLFLTPAVPKGEDSVAAFDPSSLPGAPKEIAAVAADVESAHAGGSCPPERQPLPNGPAPAGAP